jgi:hypothetical protein
MIAPTEATWVALMVLYTACLRYGAPVYLVSDSSGAYKPRQNIVYGSAERSRPCWTNVTPRIYTCWLSRLRAHSYARCGSGSWSS